jgi:Domain of unknown function (DUF6933)
MAGQAARTGTTLAPVIHVVRMLTLRCTRSIRTRLRLADLPESPPSTGVLGDWYVHLIRSGHNQFVLATSERSLLTVLLPAKELREKLTPNLKAALRALLESFGVSREAIDREIAAMAPVTFGRATNRRVLGSMNDFAFQVTAHLAQGEGNLLATSHHQTLRVYTNRRVEGV